LIGLNEDQARESITESGYAVSTVSSSLSTAPAGTVISQNPTNGVINYPGTGVEFTVSTGGATVPNLLSLSERSAISEINALGLVPSVSFSKACINPGDVLTQSPLSGTVVSTGSTVHITVDSGTYKTCILK
jgi:beta-lactam-binding protein with PASTA domain